MEADIVPGRDLICGAIACTIENKQFATTGIEKVGVNLPAILGREQQGQVKRLELSPLSFYMRRTFDPILLQASARI